MGKSKGLPLSLPISPPRVWKNGQFVYDMFGNRIRSTTDGMSTNFTYVRGNLLAGVDSNVLYEYNKDGARFQKMVDGVATKYFLDGHRIMGENRGSNTIRYFYDIDGLCGIRYNGQNYNVVRDALGNVVAITQGVEIRARYEYDSLGNCKVYNLGNSTIGDVNPFRWKGHYFDTETGFYYINGRYYDPQTASFLDAESVSAMFADSGNPLALDRNGIACVNTFAFAINATNVFTHVEMFADINYDINANKPWWEIAWNAVVNWFAKTMHAITKWYDSIPNWLKWVVGIGVLAVLAIATILTAGAAGVGVGTAFVAGFTGSAVGTGVSGLAVTIAGSAFAGAVISGCMGLISGAIAGGISNKKLSGVLEGAADGFVLGTITGAITGAIRGSIIYARTFPLIRSVSSEELSSIKSSGQFSSRGSCESKWFATNSTDASKWAEWFRQSDYVGIRVSKSALKNVYFNPYQDCIGPAYCIDVAYLNSIVNTIWYL